MACAYTITDKDKQLMYQHNLKYIATFEVIDDNNRIVDVVDGIIQGGSVSIDSTSDTRRTVSITVTPTKLHNSNMKLQEGGDVWFDKNIHMYLGILNLVTNEYVYYSQGYFVYTTAGYAYNAETNTLSLSLVDYTAMLDGTRNGQVGTLETKIIAYEEDENGVPIEGTENTIKEQMEAILKYYIQKKTLPPASIEDIGEPKGYTKFNTAAETWRSQKENQGWNKVPYDLEFSAGDTILTMINSLRDLYPNYETYFDPITNSFTCQMIPCCEGDPIMLDNNFFQKILIDESTSIDITTVKNICEVWGSVLDCDWFANSSTYADNVFSCSIDQYESSYENPQGYANGDLLGVKISTYPTTRHNHIIFVGDKRCRQMQESASAVLQKRGISADQITWYTVDAMNADWMSNDSNTSAITNLVTQYPYSSVVFMLGINDCLTSTTNKNGTELKANETNANTYSSKITALATSSAWSNTRTFVMSVLPVKEYDPHAETNDRIKDFNGKLRKGLDENIIVMDYFSTLKDEGYEAIAPNDQNVAMVAQLNAKLEKLDNEWNTKDDNYENEIESLEAERDNAQEEYNNIDYKEITEEITENYTKTVQRINEQISDVKNNQNKDKREYEAARKKLVAEIDSYTFTETYYGGKDAVYYDEKTNQNILKHVLTDLNDGNTTYLCVNGFDKIPIYNEKTQTFVPIKTFKEDDTYVFKIKKTKKNGQLTMSAYYLGQYQIHAVDVLTNGEIGGDVTINDGKGNQVTVKKYSEEYFKTKYNVQYLNMTVIKDSPFAVQKIGEIPTVESGGSFDNITSENVALENAIYYNWQNCRLTDCVTITTLLCPFLDVNMKVSYKPKNSTKSQPEEYIIKTVEHNLDSLTSSITMYHFYSYYNGLFSDDGKSE